MVNRIGIMQGRLTAARGRGIQFFPAAEWQQEFQAAKTAGLDEIEFIFDLENYEANPLWTEQGRKEINSLSAATAVKVNYICADYFMRSPLSKDNVKILKQLIHAAKEIHATGIEIPLVDNSSLKTEQDEALFVSALQEGLPTAQDQQIILGLEMDYPLEKFLKLLQKINHPWVKANYDSGNSSGLGFDPEEEIMSYGQFISNIHIKDRLLGDGTVEPGTGSADFEKLFRALGKIKYSGSFILQTARGPEGQELETIKRHAQF